MRQTTSSVVLEVEPASVGVLSGLIEQLKKDEEKLAPGAVEKYSRLKWGVPTLHFMSLSVFSGADYDPLFVMEVNFDGAPGPFWAHFEATLGDDIRPMLRCCKRPMDSDGPLYDAVTKVDPLTKAGSRYPIAPYLEHRTLQPSVFHHGNRGLDRARILREGELFSAAQNELAQPDPGLPNPYRGISAQDIHARLRKAMLGPFGWLAEPAPARISLAERARDIACLFAFLLVTLFALSLPGLLFLVSLKAFFPSYADWFLDLKLTPFLLILIVPVLAGIVLYATWPARPGEAAPTRSGGLSPSFKNEFTSLANPLTLVVAVVVALGLICAAFAILGAAAKSIFDLVVVPTVNHSIAAYDSSYGRGFFHALGRALAAFDHDLVANVRGLFPRRLLEAFKADFRPVLHVAIVGLYTAFVFSVPAILLWLRFLERRDSSHEAPPIDQRELRKMTQREDRIPQNHMGSVVLVKPGVLRMALFRAGHLGLGLVLRVVASDGYLGSMRTVHFAHWAFVNNGSRLMFFSNFDNSWDSYLDDFIEKAHGGLTLAWGSGVGFPPARFLVLDGASHGRQFKAWARHSMAVSRFWFSAYTLYTVDQVERNARIAAGLSKPALSAKEAAVWARDL